MIVSSYWAETRKGKGEQTITYYYYYYHQGTPNLGESNFSNGAQSEKRFKR